MRLARVSLAVVGMLAAVACNKPGAPPPPLDNSGNTTPGFGSGGGGGSAKDGGTDASDAGCTAIANVGSTVNETFVGEALPGALGGNLAVGTYVLTGAFVYTGVGGSAGPTGRLFSETVTFDGTLFFDVQDAGSAEAGTLTRVGAANGSYSTSASQLTLLTTCPSSASSSVPFTATGSTLRLYSGQSERVYTLQ